MSEGLEALHHPRIELARIDISAEGKRDIAYMPFYKTKQYSIIEKELKEYQQHEEILNNYNLTLANFREACLLLAMLKSEKLNTHDIAKQLKALEIIKKEIRVSNKGLYFKHYNLSGHITKEEYNLLKEVLL